MLSKVNIFVFLMMFFTFPLYAQPLNFSKAYKLYLPEWKEISSVREYETDISAIKVRLKKIDDETFVVLPVHPNRRWGESLEKRGENGLVGKMTDTDRVSIKGVMARGEAAIVLEMEGKFIKPNKIKGQVQAKIGHVAIKKFPYRFRSEWGLQSAGEKGSIDVSRKVVYEGVLRKPMKATTSTPEEQAKRPLQSDKSIKTMAKYKKKFRHSLYMCSTKNLQKYYDILLDELFWDEIKYTPGILLLIDHLATLEKVDQKRIADAYVRDGSVNFFDGIPYKEIQRTPPLFLILKCSDKMKKKDLDGLKNESERFAAMFTEFSELPKEDLSEMTPSEFMIAVSEALTEEQRKAYYSQSPKLRDYVSAAKDQTLKAFYPFHAE